jgi:integrase
VCYCLCYFDGVKHKDTEGSTEGTGLETVVARGRHARRGSYQPVFDSRKRRVRGIWKRNDRYYAQLKVLDTSGRKFAKRFPLGDEANPVDTVAKAIEAMGKLKSARSDEKLKVARGGKRFFAYADAYLEGCKLTQRHSTYVKDRSALDKWKAYLGDVALKSISKGHILRFREQLLTQNTKRTGERYTPRTANLIVGALRNVLKRAYDEELIADLPFVRLKSLKHDVKQRPYFPPVEIEHLADCAAVACQKSGEQLRDFIRLVLYSGCREGEARRLRWDDVDIDRRQLIVGSEGDTKNRKARTVDFNPQLERHLLAMRENRQPDSQWLFPSVQRWEKDVHVKSFVGALRLAKTTAAAKFPRLAGFGFHDARHTFLSVGVMAGIDFMTLAKWAGHQDGGILIGKVYGHLASEHRQAMAEKLNFQPVALERAAS